MKLTTVLLIATMMQVSAAGFAQRVTMQKKQVSLEQVFKEIKKQTGYNVFWFASELDAKILVDVDFVDRPLQDVLDVSLRGMQMAYSIEDQTVVLKKKETTFLERVVDAISAIDIQGKVIDDKGLPIPGATVRVKGSSKAAVTDKKGMFLLSKVNEDATLLISYIGYETKEIMAGDLQNAGTITLEMTTNDLNEVMINKGYYMEKQRLSTGNVSKVTAEEIEKQPVSDPILALEGKVPGLYVSQSSGIPGAFYTVQLRGRNSIQSGLDPLYIVDGVPFGSQSLTLLGGAAGNASSSIESRGGGLSPFNSINPLDIESIDILKDADATAIYGSRGANGVILITTKKGKEGDTKVDMSFSSGLGKVTRTLDLLNTQQYLKMRHEAFKNDNAIPGPGDFDINGTWDTTRYTNWQKVLTGNVARYTNAQTSISGGNKSTQFIFGVGYSNQGTVYPGDYGDKRISGHFNLIQKSNNQRFILQLSTNFSNDNSNIPTYDFSNGINLAPDAPAIYDANGNLNWQLKDGAATWANPLASTRNQSKSSADNLLANLNLSYELLPGLIIKSSFGFTKSQSNQSSIIRSSSAAPPDDNNPLVRSLDFGTAEVKTWNVEPQIVYTKKLLGGTLEALLGTTFQSTTNKLIHQSAGGFSSDALIDNPLAASFSQILNYNIIQYRYNAVFGRVNYNWEDKYLINITARRDGSSRFGPGKQFGNFGAIGLGWVFTKEAFIQDNLSFLNFGKLRASYGITGNDQLPDYQYLSSYSSILTYQGNPGLVPSRITNPYFNWEQTQKLEFGLDLGFINDRILASINYYRNRTNNQLAPYPLPFTTGFPGIQSNLPALLQNTGMEVTLNTTNLQSKDFTWSSSINLSIPKNKLISYPGIEISAYKDVYSVGYSLSSKYVYHATGVDPLTGIYTFLSKNNSGTPTFPDDLIVSEPITQKYYGGFNNSLRYKRIQLDFTFQFVKQLGHSYKSNFPMPGLFNSNQPDYVLSRWENKGDQTSIQQFSQTASPAFFAYSYLNGQPSDGVITDASFIRLKNLALSYNLPTRWLNKVNIKYAKIYFQCQNLLTFTGYKGLDPETQDLSLPPLRVITMGVQLTL